MSKDKKGGGKDEKPVPPLKIEIVKNDAEPGKRDALGDRDPLSGIDDIDIDKNRRPRQRKRK